jgi:rhodanese-related sulfurtransferase
MGKINPLRAGLLTFSILLILGMLVYRCLPGDYHVPVKNAIDTGFVNLGISPGNFAILAKSTDGEKILIVDIREAEAFEKAHLPNAINIYSSDLIERRNIKALRKKPVYLYSDNEAESHRMAYLIAMLGVNVKAVNSEYNNIRKVLEGSSSQYDNFSSQEKIRFDYQNYFKAFKESTPTPVKVTIVKPKTGGC